MPRGQRQARVFVMFWGVHLWQETCSLLQGAQVLGKGTLPGETAALCCSRSVLVGCGL